MATARRSRGATSPSTVPLRRRWGRAIARALAACLAFCGLLPLLLTLLLALPPVQALLASQTQQLIAQLGVTAQYQVRVQLWPLAAELRDVQVDSVDGGEPALRAERVLVRPRFFALLGGKPMIEEVSIEAPRVRVVLQGKQLLNLGITLPESDDEPSEPFHAPFVAISAADAQVDFTLLPMPGEASSYGVQLQVEHADLDVQAEPAEPGSEFDVSFSIARIAAQTQRRPEGSLRTLVDDDELCGVEGRVGISQAGRVVVRRLEAHGGIDLSAEPDSSPGCKLSADDPRRLDVSIGHLQLALPSAEGDQPKVQGHAALRGPLAALDRIPGAPKMDGWVSVDAEIAYDDQWVLPRTSGRFEIEHIQIAGRTVVEGAAGAFKVDQDIVEVPELAVRVSRGVARITDVTVKPLEPGIPLRATASIRGASFNGLMADLDVHPHAHVGWDLDELEVTQFGGTLMPLDLNGLLDAKTSHFGVYNAPADAKEKTRIVGFDRANFRTKVRIRELGLEFLEVNADVPGATGISHVENGYCLIGFDEKLVVNVPSAKIHLADIGPLGSLPIAGYAEVAVKVDGLFGEPKLTASGRIEDFVLGGLSFGSIEQMRTELDGLVLSVHDATARKNGNGYHVPYARIDFGGAADVDVEADAHSERLALGDVFDLFGLSGDPRFAELRAQLALNAHVRVTLGGPDDRCGTGLIEVSGEVQGSELSLFGESFASAHGAFNLRWFDQDAGLRGAELNVRSVSLYKRAPNGKGAPGVIVGSAVLSDQGRLRANAAFERVPLSSFDLLGGFAQDLSGLASGVAEVHGDLDDFTVQADVDVTPVHVRGTQLGASRLQVALRQAPESLPGRAGLPKKVARTRCGLPLGEPFDLKRYEAESQLSQGEIEIRGELFGGQVQLHNVKIAREPSPRYAGGVALRNLDLGRVYAILQPPNVRSGELETSPLKGLLSGDLTIDELRLDDLARARASFQPHDTQIQLGGNLIKFGAPAMPIVIAGDRVVLPRSSIALEAGGGVRGAFRVEGAVTELSGAQKLDVSAELTPIDLSLLAAVIPGVSRSAGRLSGHARVGGTLAEPAYVGALSVRGGALTSSALPSPITDLNLDVTVDGNELRVAGGRAMFAGGNVQLTGRMPVRGGNAWLLELRLSGRDLHLQPMAGLSAVLDCDLALSGNLSEHGVGARLPRITGDVLLSSLEYSRPINLDVSNNLSGGARRTAVESYDPDDDLVALDVRVRAKTPLRVRNNLADFQLGLDGDGLLVSGTNQRIGLRGELRALAGGKLRFLSSDFELRQASVRFDDPSRIDPYVDLLAVTEYRRVATTSAAGAGRASGTWRISLHAYGPADELRLDMTSEPSLTQEDISLLLTVGLTKAEADSLGGNALSVFAYEAAGTATGADRAVKRVIPIDDFRFGSAYSPRTGRSEPNLTVGKRLSSSVMANVTSGFTEERAQKATVEWRLSRQTSVQAGYDNINNISSTGAGNVGFDVRWRLEFE